MAPLALVAEAVAAMVVTLPLAIGLGMPTLWFLVPFAIITFARRPYEDYGLTLRHPGSPRFHLATCLAVFGTYALAHYAFAHLVLDKHFVLALPPQFFEVAFAQLVVVGLSEEFFFRGYLQTHLNRYFGRPYRFLGADLGWGLVVAALLFGLCHVVTGDLTRLRVAFFGLFAGWLRERTDTIAVPAAYHGFANILYEVMFRSLV